MIMYARLTAQALLLSTPGRQRAPVPPSPGLPLPIRDPRIRLLIEAFKFGRELAKSLPREVEPVRAFTNPGNWTECTNYSVPASCVGRSITHWRNIGNTSCHTIVGCGGGTPVCSSGVYTAASAFPLSTPVAFCVGVTEQFKMLGYGQINGSFFNLAKAYGAPDCDTCPTREGPAYRTLYRPPARRFTTPLEWRFPSVIPQVIPPTVPLGNPEPIPWIDIPELPDSLPDDFVEKEQTKRGPTPVVTPLFDPGGNPDFDPGLPPRQPLPATTPEAPGLDPWRSPHPAEFPLPPSVVPGPAVRPDPIDRPPPHSPPPTRSDPFPDSAVEPREWQLPGVDITIDPPGLTRDPLPTRPPRGVRERKFIIAIKPGGPLAKSISQITEGADFVSCIHAGLPKELQAQRKYLPRAVQKQQGQRYKKARVSLKRKAAAIYDAMGKTTSRDAYGNVKAVDPAVMADILQHCMLEHGKDQYYARLGRHTAEASRRSRRPHGYALGTSARQSVTRF